MDRTIFGHSAFKVALAISISLILFAAAVTKIIYPSPLLFNFYIVLGIFEFILAASLIIFSGQWQAWAFLALVFAAWTGYSFYATVFGLPCPCLGSAIDLPRGTTLVVDSMVLMPAWLLLVKDKRFTPSLGKRTVLLSILFFILGFVFPEVIYNIG